MNAIDKLNELKTLMGYFELVSRPNDGETKSHKWCLRNVTDEGLGQDVPFSTVKFTDENLDELLDRAISYAKSGPSKEIVKAALEVTSLFGKKTIIQGDVITIMYDYIHDTIGSMEVDNKMGEMGYKYGKYELDTVYVNENVNEIENE